MLKITNTLTGQKEEFIPLNKDKVLMYVCGITPYDFAHIGHARVYVIFDVFNRLLKQFDYNVLYCRNFTDIDDKLVARSHKEFGDGIHYQELAHRYIDAYHDDLQKLNCLPPTYEPRVTKHIDQIIEFIQELIQTGKAYIAGNDVYYHIEQFPGYGKLSKQKLDDLRAGARIEVNTLKKDPLDFALWKSEREEPYWQSPWGTGRPGWHIECSALARCYLGNQIDIHGGGMDLIFPHHENEIAQTEGLTNKIFAHYWVHNAFVRINKEKMSKSLGNFFTLHDIFKTFDPMIVRYLILTHHYRAPLDFSIEDTNALEKSYQKLINTFTPVIEQKISDAEMKQSEIVRQMLSFLCDDLNTPGMFGVLFENIKTLQTNTKELVAAKQFIQSVVGLSLQALPITQVEITPTIQALIDEREQARAQKDWARADILRKQLQDMGIEVQDKKI